MKAAFEFGFVFLFGMLFIVLGMSFGSIILTQNQARVYGETVLALIEHQNRYDASVADLIAQNPIQCRVCTSSVTHDVMTSRVPHHGQLSVKHPLAELSKYRGDPIDLTADQPVNQDRFFLML